jgi:hypothetical protein
MTALVPPVLIKGDVMTVLASPVLFKGGVMIAFVPPVLPEAQEHGHGNPGFLLNRSGYMAWLLVALTFCCADLPYRNVYERGK